MMDRAFSGMAHDTSDSAGIFPPSETASLDSASAADYQLFKECILRKTGIDLNLYKQQQMHRRLQSMLGRAGAGSFKDYFAKLERDPQEMHAFLDRMTINVSELYRNPEKWDEMRDTVLPMLTGERGERGERSPGKMLGTRKLKIWSAGCSYGAEPYSLAILLDKLSPDVRHTLIATDLDRTILAKAKEGLFTASDMKNVDDSTRSRYFKRQSSPNSSPVPEMDVRYQVDAEVRGRVTFAPHNLLADQFDTGFDLICCRNVVIYFTDPAKERLYRQFHDALRPGGILFVGGTERIFDYREIGFETPLPFFYRRTPVD